MSRELRRLSESAYTVAHALVLAGVLTSCIARDKRAVEISCAPGQEKSSEGTCRTVNASGGNAAGGAAGSAVGNPAEGSGPGGPGESEFPADNPSATPIPTELPFGERSPGPSVAPGELDGPDGTGTPTPTALATGVTADDTTFPSDAATSATDGAPQLKLRLDVDASGAHRVRVAMSHVEEITEIDYEMPQRQISVRPATADTGTVAFEPFTIGVTVSFKFRQQACRVGPVEIGRAESTHKPECT